MILALKSCYSYKLCPLFANRTIFTVSSCQRVHYNIDAKPRIIYFVEPFVSEIVIPFTPIIFIAKKHADFSIDFNCLKIVMYNVISPAIQLLSSSRRAIEFKEDRIQWMIV